MIRCALRPSTPFTSIILRPPQRSVQRHRNRRVDLYWNANTEPNLEGYDIFWSPTPDDADFEYMVSTRRHENYFTDIDVENGTTYYYKVRAYDRWDRVSGFSNSIHDTPRPDGTGLVLRDYWGRARG